MDDDVAPIAIDHVPDGHDVQLVDPVVSVKLPDGQETQVDDDMAPIALEDVPDGQTEQLDAPVIAL